MTVPEKPDELADLIDMLMAQGNGHVDIISDENGSGFKINTVKSTDCSGRKSACCQPTELDEDDD